MRGEVLRKLREFGVIHTIVLFGSRAKGIGRRGSDFDICAVLDPGKELTLKERIALENSLPEDVDLSLFQELPINIKKRVFQEGKVLYSKDLDHFLTLGKETDFEYIRYREFKADYHRSVLKKVAQRRRHA